MLGILKQSVGTTILRNSLNHRTSLGTTATCCSIFSRFGSLMPMSTTALIEPLCATLSNGVKMPRIGLGTWKLNKPDACSQAIRNCLTAKYHLIDTASVYANEAFIGKEIETFAGFKGLDFDTANGKGIFVSSKAGPHQMCLGLPKGIREHIQGLSGYLEAFGTEVIRFLPPTSDAHRKVRHESWKALEKLYQEGKVRSIGVCNFLKHHLEDLIEDGVEVVPMVDQLEVHPLCPNHELRDIAKKLGIVVQAYSSLGSGSEQLLQHPVVLEVAEMEDRPVCQILLRWAVQQDICVIPRSVSLNHQRDNIAVLDWELKVDSMDRLNSICPKTLGSSGEKHFCWDPASIP